MKKATLILWVIIFGFIALFIFQNQDFFLAQNAYNLNLGIKHYSVPQLYNAILVLVFFFAGLSIAYLFSFSSRFKAKRTIKKLNTTIASHLNEMAELKDEINKLKGLETPVDGQADTIKLDLNATRTIAPETGAESPADQTVKFAADDAAENPATVKFAADDDAENPAEDTKVDIKVDPQEDSSEKKD
jgi:hypothetical protein